MTYTVTRSIDAPLELVFDTVGDISNFSKAIPHITKVEIVSDIKSGVGTRFRETRMMKGKESTCELEVTEYAKNDRVRIVTDTAGTIWDSKFTVLPNAGHIDLTLRMEATPHTLISRIMNVFVKKILAKALEDDLDAVKTYCEKS